MVLDFAPADDSRRADALALILSQARRRDALTLWHLLTRGTESERMQVFGSSGVARCASGWRHS
jgi:hypothetical protein